MKIAIVADKKAGHLSQCLGLRDIIQNYKKEKDVFILEGSIFFAGFIERAITLISEKLYLFVMRLMNQVLWILNMILCCVRAQELSSQHIYWLNRQEQK